MTRTRVFRPLVVAVLTVLVASGCAATSPVTPPPSSTPEESPCFVGEWELDLDAVAEQAIGTLAEQGLAVERLTLDGRQLLTIGEPEAGTGEFSVDSELTAVATVGGAPVDVPLSGSGSGVYALDGDETFLIESWTFEADEDTTFPLGLPFQGDAPVTIAECSESQLVLGESTADSGLLAPYSRRD